MIFGIAKNFFFSQYTFGVKNYEIRMEFADKSLIYAYRKIVANIFKYVWECVDPLESSLIESHGWVFCLKKADDTTYKIHELSPEIYDAKGDFIFRNGIEYAAALLSEQMSFTDQNVPPMCTEICAPIHTSLRACAAFSKGFWSGNNPCGVRIAYPSFVSVGDSSPVHSGWLFYDRGEVVASSDDFEQGPIESIHLRRPELVKYLSLPYRYRFDANAQKLDFESQFSAISWVQALAISETFPIGSPPEAPHSEDIGDASDTDVTEDELAVSVELSNGYMRTKGLTQSFIGHELCMLCTDESRYLYCDSLMNLLVKRLTRDLVSPAFGQVWCVGPWVFTLYPYGKYVHLYELSGEAPEAKFVPGADFATSLLKKQYDICYGRHQIDWFGANPTARITVPLGFDPSRKVLGARFGITHFPLSIQDHTGWVLFNEGDWGFEPGSLRSIRLFEIHKTRPDILQYLGLPEGWMFDSSTDSTWCPGLDTIKEHLGVYW